jgi:Arc/MetJ-type ribon-helix-helix transcriptional regulator
MTIHLPHDIESSIQAAVHSGHFSSVDEAMAKAARLLLQSLNEGTHAARKPLTEQELERKLLESGFLASVPPPPDPAAPAWSFEPVKIEGEPLSETVIRERR